MNTPIQRPVTIGVTGTHSTGKSTWLARLARELRSQDIEVATVSDLGEEALRRGLPILHSHTFTSTLWIISRGISHEVETWDHAEVLLIDRPVPDALGYYQAALAYHDEQPDPTAMHYLQSLVTEHCRHYDLLLRTTLDPTVPLGTNKPRSTRADFRLLADRHIGEVLQKMQLPHRLLPADGHDDALKRALTFTYSLLAGDPIAGWPSDETNNTIREVEA